jgi:electron transfer flavoprotein alpha subunit
VILVIAEQRDGRLNRASWEAIAAAQALAGGAANAGAPVKVAILGGAVGTAAGELASAGVAEVFTVEDPSLA